MCSILNAKELQKTRESFMEIFQEGEESSAVAVSWVDCRKGKFDRKTERDNFLTRRSADKNGLRHVRFDTMLKLKGLKGLAGGE